MIIAVVVTYNRKTLLLECLSSIFQQTKKVDKILLVNNASTDGTEEALRENGYLTSENIDYRLMETNTGGSGGFYYGIKEAMSYHPDWVWIMDDDTIPQNDCLENLYSAGNRINRVSYLASCIKGSENEPMNVPTVDLRDFKNGYPFWYEHLSNRLIRIRCATFVSLLIRAEAIKKCGFPCRDYFIWGDDTEYTYRLTKYYDNAYLVGNSWAIHKRFNAKQVDIRNEDNTTRVNNYFYYYRNNLINTWIYESPIAYFKTLIKFLGISFQCLLKPNGLKKCVVIQKGIFTSVKQRKKIIDYINNELNPVKKNETKN